METTRKKSRSRTPTLDELRVEFGMADDEPDDPDEPQFEPSPADLFKPPGYRIGHVLAAVLVFFAILGTFGARGLHKWTTKLPVTTLSAKVRKSTESWWGRAAALGLETPAIKTERLWLAFQEASPLLYPKTYDEVMAQRRLRAKHKQLAALKTGRRAARRSASAGPSVLLIGDSIMAGIGPVIKNDVSARLAGSTDLVAKVATGLARPDVFDWRGELKRTGAEDHYDHLVMMLGTNDSQDFVDDGRILTYGTEAWVKAYKARLDEIMSSACAAADKAYWVALPPMKSAAFNRKAARINHWAERQAALHPCVRYVSLDRVIGDEKGTFTSYIKIENTLEKVRNVDGIHITQKGGSLVSQALIDLISSK